MTTNEVCTYWYTHTGYSEYVHDWVYYHAQDLGYDRYLALGIIESAVDAYHTSISFAGTDEFDDFLSDLVANLGDHCIFNGGYPMSLFGWKNARSYKEAMME